ncbi:MULTISPECIES: ribonuclease III [Holospora]|uniref:Ribonuclease 3 n=2 Tax=Holospora TaxID=44747 RepID=A0A061JIQ8_9PROT|nr:MULTISPECIES: ribonuclease III [Holospora]ETZ05014.1 ribonuclease 3 [Holospora undulata HU1]GAJ45821.1 ribonuclease 3 [Holospora elegans E1]
MSNREKILNTFQDQIGYKFKDPQWLKKALTHSSAGGNDFERLEYLGDRLLSCVMTLWIFSTYSQDREGTMTKRLAYLVSGPRIHQIALQLGIPEVLHTDKRQDPNQPRLIIDACEALIAAIMLDSGDFVTLERCIHRWWENLFLKAHQLPLEAKSVLQEWTQSNGYGLPVYTVLCTTGPYHKPLFEVQVNIGKKHKFQASGGSKKEAEQKAAQRALSDLTNCASYHSYYSGEYCDQS